MSNEESSSSDDWKLNPLFINHAPTEEEIQRSKELQGIRAMMENADPFDKMGIYRTQGNQYMELALKQEGEERRQGILNAITLYNQALDVEVKPSEETTQDMIDEKKAVTLSNRAECFRLLKDFGRAAADAYQASQVYPRYFKAHLRMGRICEDLCDWVRASHYYENALKLNSGNGQIQKALNAVQKNLREMESKYEAIQSRTKNLFDFPLRFGALLPYVNLQLPQILQSFQHNGVTIYLMSLETKEITTIQGYSVNATFGSLAELIGMKKAKFFYEVAWCDPFEDKKFKTAKASQRKRIDIAGHQTVRQVLKDERYTVPGVVCFFIE